MGMQLLSLNGLQIRYNGIRRNGNAPNIDQWKTVGNGDKGGGSRTFSHRSVICTQLLVHISFLFPLYITSAFKFSHESSFLEK